MVLKKSLTPSEKKRLREIITSISNVIPKARKRLNENDVENFRNWLQVINVGSSNALKRLNK